MQGKPGSGRAFSEGLLYRDKLTFPLVALNTCSKPH